MGGLVGAPWVPAFKKDIDRMLNDAELKKDQVYIELGCGDGRLVAAAAQMGAIAIGYEVNPLMWLIALIRNIPNRRASIRLANFWYKDLSQADVVMAFLMPKFMARLQTKVQKELKPGARLISYIFDLPTKRPLLKRKKWQVYKF